MEAVDWVFCLVEGSLSLSFAPSAEDSCKDHLAILQNLPRLPDTVFSQGWTLEEARKPMTVEWAERAEDAELAFLVRTTRIVHICSGASNWNQDTYRDPSLSWRGLLEYHSCLFYSPRGWWVPCARALWISRNRDATWLRVSVNLLKLF